MKKFNIIILLLFIAALLAGTAFSQTQGGATDEGAAPCANCPGPGGMGMHHGMGGPSASNMPCGCGMQGMGMGGCGCGCGCGMHGMGMMGGGIMGGMDHGMCGMHKGMGRGMMSSGLLGIMGVHPSMSGMRALNDPMVKEHLAKPEIKSFLDETKDLRRNLLLRKFDYFEAARNPQTKPEDLKKLRQEIKKLQADIYVKSPDIMDMSEKDDSE